MAVIICAGCGTAHSYYATNVYPERCALCGDELVIVDDWDDLEHYRSEVPVMTDRTVNTAIAAGGGRRRKDSRRRKST